MAASIALMNRPVLFLIAAVACVAQTNSAKPQEETVTFRSDVSLVRVDVQVLDRDNRAVTGLSARDFVLRDEGRLREIRNFAREDMPVDVLMLFDVSASMRPHVQRVASAARQAMNVLTDKDRVGIMVFDRQTRVRLPFRGNRDDVDRELQNMMRQENFRGGTDITRAMLDAADYIRAMGRKDARRAIIILTDDMTEFERDEDRVGRALIRSDAVLSALIAPDAMAGRNQQRGGYPGNNGGYPGGGQRRGGITLGGGGWGIPGTGYPGGGGGGGRRGGGGYPGNGGSMPGRQPQSAGTAQIARDSGGDSLPVDDASALETTLSRIRQRYALYFLVPPGARSGQQRNIEVALSDAARTRVYDADVRYRRTYVSPVDNNDPVPPGQVDAPVGANEPTIIRGNDRYDDTPRRRRAVSEPDGPRVSVTPREADPDRPILRRAPGAETPDTPTPAAKPDAKPDDQAPIPSKWRKLKPGEVPNQP